ncbi:MAG TPA: hypothetical protein VH834_10290 [Solirubrobacteraceae bacterium]|jgi:hypothetical protein
MSIKHHRRYAALAVAGVAALAIPATGLARSSHSVNMKLVGKLSGVTITGTAKGKPFGNCTNKAKLIIPNEVQVWTCKGGKVTIKSHGTTGAANAAKGTWKVTKGTGKFKGITGHGTFSGLQSTGKFTYKGTVSY